MSYFPFFFELSGKRGLIAGGGKVALEKVSKLSEFGADLSIVSKSFVPELSGYVFSRITEREIMPEDISGFDYCIAATDDRSVNRRIAGWCREKGIPVNVADDREMCDFIFPSVIKRGDLTVGVTTSGKSPHAAVLIRKSIEDAIPGSIEEILDYLGKIREKVKELPCPIERRSILKKAAEWALSLGRPLDDTETAAIMNGEDR
ncbi:MAG: bifunctional precorrin-2 dehydrogenase/sirohydrochlorin ferrochelatase [Lachnospiraceae bacterium]|nr:bifunctional precorrin-2 dehydrogenase/sirohydrochlorin ferrochelatase [Lachnospiraceae bacterium]